MTLCELLNTLYGARRIYASTGGEVSIDCPFCPERVGKKDDKHRLGINTSTGTGNCFRCEKRWKKGKPGGKQFWFRELCRVYKANYVFSPDAGDTVEGPSNRIHESTQKSVTRLPEEYEPLWKNITDRIGRQALKYVLRRGITHEQIRRHKIGFASVGKFTHRIIFPVYSSRGRLKAFVARDWTNTADYKYLNSAGTRTLYNVPKQKKKVVCLVEGIIDCLSFERSSVGKLVDCVAGLGKSLTKKQVRILAQWETVVIWPDPDRPGIEGAIKRAQALLKKKVNVAIVLPDEDIETDTDLGNMRTAEIDERYKGQVPYSSSVAARMRLRVASATPKRKKRK